MDTRFALLLIAALSASASAQTRWVVELDRPWVTPSNPTVTVRFSAQFPPLYTAFASANLDLHSTEQGWSSQRVLLPPPNNPGTISGSVITGINAGQVHFPPIVLANPANPIDIYEVRWSATDFTRRLIEFRTHTHRYDVYEWPPGTTPPRLLPFLTEGRAQIRVVPAPATALILTISAATALRRQRRVPDTRHGQ